MKSIQETSSATPCPVCGSSASLWSEHPEARLYHCSVCDHRFSRLIGNPEPYDPNYFEETHQNWFANPDIKLFEYIIGLIPHSSQLSLIDVGCGNGAFLRRVKAKRPDVELYGLDIAPTVSEPGIMFLQGDIISIQLDKMFDLVTSLAVIEHVPDARGMAARLQNLCKPGGLVAVMTLNDRSILYSVARMARTVGFNLPFVRLYSAHHVHHFTNGSLQRLLTDAGLCVVDVHHHNPPLAAMDIPVKSRLLQGILRSAVYIIFILGKLSRRTYLQTVIARRET